MTVFAVTVAADDPSRGWIGIGARGRCPCALGKAGVRIDKREGDGATPLGTWALRRIWYRADRLAQPPRTALPVREIRQDDGWCDDVSSPDYNRHVALPHPAGHERLWRDDAIYDVVVELGCNDDPPVPGRGSAIFLHVARQGFLPTEGCIALALDDLLALSRIARPGDALRVGAT